VSAFEAWEIGGGVSAGLGWKSTLKNQAVSMYLLERVIIGDENAKIGV
jgi:hypothetical protein